MIRELIKQIQEMLESTVNKNNKINELEKQVVEMEKIIQEKDEELVELKAQVSEGNNDEEVEAVKKELEEAKALNNSLAIENNSLKATIEEKEKEETLNIEELKAIVEELKSLL